MAIDNLNYYSAWLPAGQQTDRYSSQPWCLRSKNLDIFSSSKSVKATAFSQPVVSGWSDIIKQDWKLILKTDWKVYERVNGVDTLVVDPSQNFPVYKACYTWKNGTYADATWGTAKDLVVKNIWDEWESFVVFSDRASYIYSKTRYTPTKSLSSQYTRWRLVNWLNRWDWWYIRWYENSSWSQQMEFDITINECIYMAKVPIRIKINAGSWADFSTWTVTITWPNKKKYYYDAQLNEMVTWDNDGSFNVSLSWSLANGFTANLPVIPTWTNQKWTFNINWGYSWDWWQIWVDANAFTSYNAYTSWTADPTFSPDPSMKDWDFNYYYKYLPIDEDRHLVPITEYYWLPTQTFQTLYNWAENWADVNGEKRIRYDFQAYMWWDNPSEMTIIWLIVWNEQVYMIGNMHWNWYIFPCDLSWWRWTPYIAYGCIFNWVTNIDYLMYLVWEDRGISQLWVFNNQELVSLVWGNQEKDKKNLIKNEEQYKFDWKIVEYRGNLILSTEDNRLFEYGQTYGGKWGTFIHEIDGEIKELKAEWNDLTVKYTKNNIDYSITYQDDTPIKNYNLEWMAEYPIILWNHLLEKEESDLFVSYILPSADCSLEFWGMANHYHFRTFTSSDSYTFSTTASYKMKGCTWDYELKFIEKNGNQYTFRLEWDLPIQTTNDMKIADTEWVELINYSEYNHFRKIWTIETDKYCEWEFRFHNLNNKLELPKSHSLQIMVKGKGTQNYTPELFALDLVANQRERW